MVTQVIKRNGKKQKFKKKKVEEAILRAYAVTADIDEKAIAFAAKVASDIEEMNATCLTVEEVQDAVERKLMGSSHKDVAKVYINYRYLKNMARTQYEELIDAVGDKLKASNVQNQNANVDEHSFGGRVGEASSVITKSYALNYLVSDMARQNHENNEIYIHDLDAFSVGSHNCMSIPFDDLLAKGFNTRQTDVRPANSVGTAMQLVAVIFQLQSLQQFGGVSATHLDWTMVPYVRKSFHKHYKDGLKYFKPGFLKKNPDIEALIDAPIDSAEYKKNMKAYEYAMEQTTKETYQAVEGMYHNLNTLQSRSGNQLPFTSINYGTCTSPEGRMVIKALLDTSIKGLGKLHKTSIFPCGIFQYWKGVNDKPGTPNYDMYQLALKSTSLRLYPNYANVDWSGNAGFDPKDPKTYFSTMGAACGDETVSIKIDDHLYENIRIQDAFYVIKNSIRYQDGCNHRTVLGQRPGQFKDICGVYRLTDKVTGHFYIGSSKNIGRRYIEHRFSLKHKGTLGDNYFINDFNVENLQLEVLESCPVDELFEVESKYIMKHFDEELCVNQKDSINNGNFTSENRLIALSGNQYSDFKNKYATWVKKISDSNILIKSGLEWVPVRAIMMNTANCPLAIYEITYFNGEDYVTLKVTEDHPLHTGRGRVRADKLEVGDYLIDCNTFEHYTIESIIRTDEHCETFDFETDNDKFNLSGIISHNCRTANGADINADPGVNPQTKDGRGNICPTTIIMPTLAMEAKEMEGDVIENFMALLDKKIHEAKDSLIERFDWIASQDPCSAKFMYENNVMLGYNPDEGIRSALKHGTLAIGQLGLAETLQILIGKDHTTPEGMEIAKMIESLFKARCAEFKKTYKLNFGVYYTPAENLCFTAMKKFKAKYGEIPNVSDKDYFTNSMHVPVWHSIDPYEKIDIESQLTGYSSAGCITYVELDASCKHNTKALEKIVNYAMDHDIPYFAVNIPNDTCLECGYTDEIGGVCPKCGSENIQRLRRVTGYLTGNYTTAFNYGKQKETEDRVKHRKTYTGGDC